MRTNKYHRETLRDGCVPSRVGYTTFDTSLLASVSSELVCERQATLSGAWS
jgi:hypothetical protein